MCPPSDRLPCGALRRRVYRDSGWHCSGRDLVRVMSSLTCGKLAGVPIVLPARLVASWRREFPMMPYFTPSRIPDFTDHVHLTYQDIPIRRAWTWLGRRALGLAYAAGLIREKVSR